MASATDELTLLERVFFRIGSADSDEQLQSAVSKFLPPVLLKLSSQQDGVRKKVMELLVHINKRIKSRPQVQLPVEALLLQYQDPSASSFVTNFTIIYIKLGYPRLPLEKQAELVPCMLNALEGKPQSHQDSLLLLLMPVLGHVTIPADPKKQSSLFGLGERLHVAKQLAQFMLDLLLLPYGAVAQQEHQEQAAQQQQQSGSNSAMSVPLGMSEYGFRRVMGEAPMKPDQLEQAKLGVVKFLSGGVLADADVLVHLVVAAADTRFSVANAADMQLKKIVGSLDWGSPLLTGPLYQLFLGTQLLSSKTRTNATKPEHRHQPAGTRIRLKILPYLCRARGQALLFPACIQVFFDSLYGTNTNARLKNMALQFSMLIILGSSLARLTPVAGVLLSGLLKLIPEEEGPLKSLAYTAAGKLGNRVPHLVNKDLALLQTFFDALSQEDPETRMSVREALLSMVDAFRCGMDEQSSSQELVMVALLASQVESNEPMARFVAVRYAATVFPADHSPSRYLLLLACGDSKDEVSSEAKKALYKAREVAQDAATAGSKEELDDKHRPLVLPSFNEMINLIADKAHARMHNAAVRRSLPFNPGTFTEIVTYLHMCLWKSAEVPVSQESTFECSPSKWTPLVGRYVRRLQETQSGRDTTCHYVELIQQLVTANASALPLACLLEVVGSAPDLLVPNFTGKLNWLWDFVVSTKEGVREAASSLYGIVAAYGLKEQQFNDTVMELVKSIETKALEIQHGSVLALSRALERRIAVVKDVNREKLMAWPAYAKGVACLVTLLSHQNALLVGAACSGLGEMACRCALPLASGTAQGKSGKLYLVEKLQEIMNSPKLTTKLKERAAQTLGCLCIGEQFPHSHEIIQGFLSLAKETRDVEVHFSVGEALVCCVQGTTSPRARDAWSQLESEFQAAEECRVNTESIEWLMDELLNNMVLDLNPNSRQACCIWLLAILKHCSQQAVVKKRLESMQKIFMEMLSENNDIVQDVASKGLGLVYECSDKELQSRLVKELVEQLTSGRRTVPQVTSDTKLFEEGQLGKAPTGGNLCTYKELCSLASDLNKPELIYTFMHLANHHAMWNSKKGAAYGFSTIAASAGEQLSAHFSEIVPRLYRYQYDPTPRIQMSMASIWRAFVRDPQKTIEQYYKEIMDDLVTNLTDPQWRVRMSCCLALSDLLSSGKKSLNDCLSVLPHLWMQLFRVMDDVHEGTRQAATNTTRVLSKLTVRNCNASQGKAGEQVVQTILPVLLQTGIRNTVSEIRAVSLQCVSQLVASTGKLLKPHLAVLIPALLEAASEMETKALCRLSVEYSAEAQTQEKIDSLRASAAKSHYTTETVTKCLQYIDTDNLEELVPRVVELMRSSVGLGTRVATAHFVVLLTHHLRQELKPYTGKLLAALVNGLLDRNAAIRKNYATTIGHLVSTAKDSSLDKLFAKLRAWYFEKENESVHSALAYTLQAISQHQQELLKEYSSSILPLVFLALHAPKLPEKGSVEVWEEVWQESTPGTEAGIRQHMAGICSILKEALESSSWTMKAQAAGAVATVASKMGSAMDAKSRDELVQILLSGLSGRTWTGKEKLLHALASICTSCKDAMKEEDCSKVVDALLKECRKEQTVYKRHALQALGNVLVALQVDRFDDVYLIIKDVIDRNSSEDKEEDQEENMQKEAELLQLREVAFEMLGKAWPSTRDTQVRYQEQILEQCVCCLTSSTRGVQVAVLMALRHFVEKLVLLDPSNIPDDEEQKLLSHVIVQVSQAVTYGLGVAKHTRLKKEALNVLYILVKKLRESQQTASMKMLMDTFWKQLEDASKDNTPEIKSRVVDIKDLMS